MNQNLLAIGDFSTLSRLSVRMLRHYDQHGVLSPHHIDDHTGYRWYAHGQLADAARVRHLRDAGVPVAAMREVLQSADSDDVRRLLLVHQASLKEAELHAALRSQAVDSLLASLTTHPEVGPISRLTIAPGWIASVRDALPDYTEEGNLWCRLVELAGQAYAARAEGPSGAIYHDGEYKEVGCDVEIFIPVRGPVEVTAPAAVTEAPGLEVLMVTHRGPYSLADAPIQVLGEELGRQGLQQSGPMRWRYMVSPAHTTNEHDFVTEICLPI